MSELIVERRGPVETWTLNRPAARNALDRHLVARLETALGAAEAAHSEIIVLKGAGYSFCAGADLALLSAYDVVEGPTPRDHLTAIWNLTLAMERSPMTFIAELHGHAVAGGLELALACDVVLAATGTLIGDGHVRRCLLPGGGASARMERNLGRATSTWLALTGELLPAEDRAFACWLRAVVPEHELADATDNVVATLRAAPATARGNYKQLLYETHGALSDADRDRELDAFDQHWRGNDVPQALRSFLSKNREAS